MCFYNYTIPFIFLKQYGYQLRRQQAVAHELLKRWDILWVEQLAEKAQPGLRCRRAFVVRHRELVAAELALRAEATV